MNNSNLPYAFQWSQTHPHIAWVDINRDNTLVEVAVIAQNQANGDLHFIPIASMDKIDRARMKSIIERRDANKYQLWDLLDQRTLKNGMNALDYFYQMVRVLPLRGPIFTPGQGRVGLGNVVQNHNAPVRVAPEVAQEQKLPANDLQAANEYAVRKGPGRPSTKK